MAKSSVRNDQQAYYKSELRSLTDTFGDHYVFTGHEIEDFFNDAISLKDLTQAGLIKLVAKDRYTITMSKVAE